MRQKILGFFLPRGLDQQAQAIFERHAEMLPLPTGRGPAKPVRISAVFEVQSPRAVVIVEGVSDQVALETLAFRRNRDLDAEGVSIVPIGGAHALTRYIATIAHEHRHLKLAGLCDVGEEGAYRRALEQAGFGSNLTRLDLEGLGFFVCVLDLEDELIRALGVTAVENVIQAEGDGQPLRSFQNQPAQRGRSPEASLRRFMGTHSGRKAKYARALVNALDLTRVPHPLDGVLAAALSTTGN